MTSSHVYKRVKIKHYDHCDDYLFYWTVIGIYEEFRHSQKLSKRNTSPLGEVSLAVSG